MNIEEHQEGDTLVIRILEPRLDAHVAVDFKTTMTQLIDAGHARIALNFSATEFIDSSGLGAIVSALKYQGQRGELVLCELQDATASMFKLTRMDKVFSIFAKEREAIDAGIAA